MTDAHKNIQRWQFAGYPLMVTFRTQSLTLTSSERDLVVSAARHFHQNRYVLHEIVCMPDHVHIILTPNTRENGAEWSISQIVHSLKGYTAHRINQDRHRSGKLWQKGFYERVIRSERDLREKVRYVWENPLRGGLVEDPALYPHTWNRWYHGVDTTARGGDAAPTRCGRK